MSKELEYFRHVIDHLDEELINTLSRRMKVIPQVAMCKKENGIPRCHPKRERGIISAARVLAKSKDLNPDLVEAIMKLIIAEAHRIEKEIIGE